MFPGANAPVVPSRVATSREVRIGCPLIFVRALLVASTGRFVAIRPRLTLATLLLLMLASECVPILSATITKLGSPIAIVCRLVAIARSLIAGSMQIVGSG